MVTSVERSILGTLSPAISHDALKHNTSVDSQVTLLGLYPTDRLVHMEKRHLPMLIHFGIADNHK